MTESTQNQLVAALARDIVAGIAPQELPTFRAQSEAYFQDPAGALESQAAQEEMLAFGAGGAATFLTPAVLAVTTTVVNFAVEAVKESIKDESKELIGDAVGKMFKKLQPEEKKEGAGKKGKEPELVALTPDQLKKVRELAYGQALQLRLSESTAETLAESLVGSLVLAS